MKSLLDLFKLMIIKKTKIVDVRTPKEISEKRVEASMNISHNVIPEKIKELNSKEFVLKAQTDFGFLGTYNSNKGYIPFERFYLGGDGMQQYAMDGRETISLRGYENGSLSSRDGSVIYNKSSLELRYPISLKPSASVFALSFLEAGNGFDNFKDYSPFDVKRSAGIGVRVFMPAFGLLGIDFGYGFDSTDLSNSGQASGWQTHFVIGQQF